MLIVLAVVFLVVLFLLKNNTFSFENKSEKEGLVADDISLAEFVNRDIDGDGLLDWEETLIGTDLELWDTDGDGISDGDQYRATLADAGDTSTSTEDGMEFSQTQTAKLSQELFATIAAMSQVGELDPTAAEQLTNEIIAKVQNADPRKVYAVGEINISTDNSPSAFQKYIADIENIYKKYPAPSPSAIEILVEFAGDGENTNPDALIDLSPIVTQTENVLGEMTKMGVPSEIAMIHLDLVNVLERLRENLEDMLLFEVDPILAAGGMSNYEGNEAYLQDVLQELGDTIKAKLGNG